MKVLPLFLGAGALVGIFLFSKTSKAQSSVKLCNTPPPSPQPVIPPGFSVFQGPVDAVSSAAARSALKNPLGHFEEFQDSAGRSLAVIVSWHCHEEGSGLRPIGWHKGANLLERKVSA